MDNKRYSLLVIALYCFSGHVKAMLNHLKAKNSLVDITILTEKPDEYRDLADKFVKTVYYNVSSVDWIKIRSLRFFATKYMQIRFFSKFSKNRRFDIINIHFANRYMSFVYKYLRAMSENIIMIPWGSDILRRPKKNLEQLAYLYQKADYIAASTSSPVGRKILQEFKVNPKKIVGSFWGSAGIDYAIKIGEQISENEAKRRFGLSGRYVITCGYNKQESQRHKAIIQAIDLVRDQLPNNLTLLFPMNYGGWTTTEKYGEEIKKECKERGIHAVFITEFLTVEDLYKLRKATDMFVHVQTTDAFSGSVQEYILCNKKIVHGSWIKYEELENYNPLFYFPVDKLDNLGEVIVKAYISDNIAIPEGVFNYIKSSSWENKASLMNDFYMSVVYNLEPQTLLK